MLSFVMMSRLAHKLVYYAVAIGPFALVFWICRGYFNGWPDAWTMLAFIASLLMSFLLGFFLEATLGMIGFWFLEVSSLLFVYMLLSFFFSGQMFPLDMMPPSWPAVMKVIPLQYLAYFPAAVFLQKVTGAELARGLAVEAIWVVIFCVSARTAFHYGVRRYSAFGG
jgi:ABC-2 type transport system permease protein